MNRPKTIYVEEWTRIVLQGSKIQSSMDHVMNSFDFKQLYSNLKSSPKNISKVLEIGAERGEPFIRTRNYVGVFRASSNLLIEIGPKIPNSDKSRDPNDFELVNTGRKALLRMMSVSKNIEGIFANKSSQREISGTLVERIARNYLQEIMSLFAIGIRSGYQRITSSEKFLRGKLLFSSLPAECRYNKSLMYCEYDIYVEDIAPNRLILESLYVLESMITAPDLRKNIEELIRQLSHVSRPKAVMQEIYIYDNNQKWRETYGNLMPIVLQILMNNKSIPISGEKFSYSFLYPTERLFEMFVAKYIQKNYADWSVKIKDRSNWFVDNSNLVGDKSKIWLEPDMISRKKKLIMDTKWKALDLSLPNWGLAISDLYQMHAYSSIYSNKDSVRWNVGLIYPSFSSSNKSLELQSADGFNFRIFRLNLATSNLHIEFEEMLNFFSIER